MQVRDFFSFSVGWFCIVYSNSLVIRYIEWAPVSKLDLRFKFLFSFRTNVLREPCADPGPTFSGPFLAFALLSLCVRRPTPACRRCRGSWEASVFLPSPRCLRPLLHVLNSHWTDLSASWFKLFLGDTGLWCHLLLLSLQLSASQPGTFLSTAPPPPPSQPKMISQGICSNVWKHFCML